MQVQRVGVHQGPGCTHHGHFHAGTKAGIQTNHPLLAGRRRQQQLLEIAPENRDRFIIGARLELHPQFHFNRR